MKYSALLLFACLILAVALPLGSAAAQGRPDRQPLVIAQSNGPSLDEAVEQVRRQYHGRIVSAETKIVGNREMHYIKVLTDDGKVKTVKVPGRTLGKG